MYFNVKPHSFKLLPQNVHRANLEKTIHMYVTNFSPREKWHKGNCMLLYYLISNVIWRSNRIRNKHVRYYYESNVYIHANDKIGEIEQLNNYTGDIILASTLLLIKNTFSYLFMYFSCFPIIAP